MSDDPPSADDPSDKSTVDGTQIDDILERLEDSFDSDSTDSIPDTDTGTDTETNTSGRSESQSTDGSTGARLWDRFSTDNTTPKPDQSSRSSTTEAERPTSGRQTSTSSAAQDATESTTATTTTTATATETDQPTTDDPQPTRSSTPDTDTATSFRSILDRISHRIDTLTGRSASESSTAETTETTETAKTTETATDTHSHGRKSSRSHEAATAAAGGEQTGQQPSTSGGGASVASARSQSEQVAEILNNIDLFGRATSSSQVLLLSPTAHSMTNDIFHQFLLPDDGSGQNVLFVSATQSIDDQLAAAQEIPDWVDGETAVIEVGQSALQSAQSAGANRSAQLDIYKQISNLQNLAKLGVNISHIVSQWNGNRRPTVVGVHTLSAIQQYVGNETMFQFLFTLKGQLNSMGVMGFYHMDPSVHTDNEISTIQSAFDLVVTISPDGTVDID